MLKSFLLTTAPLAAALTLTMALAPRTALAADDDDTQVISPPLPPPPPAPSDGNAPAPATVSAAPTGVVNVNHVDNVIVAQSGSHVAVESHDSSSPIYASDPPRKAAIIASPIVYGVGAAVAGIGWLATKGNTVCTTTYTTLNSTSSCTTENAVPALVLYDAITTIVPSIPRWVVGDTSGAVIYTGLRGAAVLTASLVDWGNGPNDWLGPFFLGFLAPVTLAIVDLALTPHREDLVAPKPAANTGFQLVGISPTTLTDPQNHVNGGTLQVSAIF